MDKESLIEFYSILYSGALPTDPLEFERSSSSRRMAFDIHIAIYLGCSKAKAQAIMKGLEKLNLVYTAKFVFSDTEDVDDKKTTSLVWIFPSIPEIAYLKRFGKPLDKTPL